MITLLDILSSVFLFSLLFLILLNWFRDKMKSRLVLFIAFAFLFISTIFNLPEHLLNTAKFDDIEVLFDVMFIPTLILSIQISIIDQELIRRKISEKRFKAIFNQAFSLMGMLDKKGRLLTANENALKMAGVSMSDVKNTPFQDTHWWSHSPEEREKLLDAYKTVKEGDVVRFETNHLDSNKNVRFIDFSLTPVYSNNELINYIVEGRDITELKKAQLELEKHRFNLELLVKEKTDDLETANEELQAINEELYDKNEVIFKKNNELNETIKYLKEAQSKLVQAEKMASLGTLTAGVAHEINNPLNFVMGGYVGLTNYFEDFGSKDKERTDFWLNSIKSGVERVSDIVQGLNQFSRDNKLYSEDCNIHSILDNCSVILNAQLQEEAHILKDYGAKYILTKGNTGKLHQVFVNVIYNAIQAIEKGGEVAITTSNADSKTIVVEIKDDGCGISKENLKSVTDPFFTTKPPGEGTGLGLSITYSIIKEHKGTINFESEEGNGTKVTITLPLVD